MKSYKPYIATKYDYYNFLNSHEQFKSNSKFTFEKFRINIYNLTCFGLSYEEIIADPLILNLETKDLKNRLKLCLLADDNIKEFLEYKFLYDVPTIFKRYKNFKKSNFNNNSIYYHSPASKTDEKIYNLTDENYLLIRSDFSKRFHEINNNLQLFKIRLSRNDINISMNDYIKSILPAKYQNNDKTSRIVKNLVNIKNELGTGTDFISSILKRNSQLVLLDEKQFSKFYDYLYNDCRISKTKIIRMLKTRFDKYYTKYYNKQLFDIFYPDSYIYQLNSSDLKNLEDRLKLSFLFNNHNPNQFINTLLSNCNPPEKYFARIMANYDGLIPDFALYLNDQVFHKETNLSDEYLQKLYPYNLQIKNEVYQLFKTRYPEIDNQVKFLKLNSLDVSKLNPNIILEDNLDNK